METYEIFIMFFEISMFNDILIQLFYCISISDSECSDEEVIGYRYIMFNFFFR